MHLSPAALEAAFAKGYGGQPSPDMSAKVGGGGGSRTLKDKNIQVGDGVELLANALHFHQFPISPGLCPDLPVTPALPLCLGNMLATT